MAPPKLRSPFSGAALPTTAGVEPPERGRWTGKRGSHRAHTLPLPHACPLPHGRPTSHVNRQASPERSHTSVPCKRAEILRKTRVVGKAGGRGRKGRRECVRSPPAQPLACHQACGHRDTWLLHSFPEDLRAYEDPCLLFATRTSQPKRSVLLSSFWLLLTAFSSLPWSPLNGDNRWQD